MSDMKRLIEKMDQFAGQAVGQKPGDQVRGTEKATPKKSGKHPFAGRLVGASESKSMLADLEKELVEGAVKRGLKEEFEAFKAEGVAEGAPELLKAEMPLVRHIEQGLEQHGYQKGTEEYKKVFDHMLSYYRKFGNFGFDNQGVAEGMTPDNMFLDKASRVKQGDKVVYKGKVVGIATGEVKNGQILFKPVEGDYARNMSGIATLPIDDIYLKEDENPRIDLTPNYPNYSKLIGEFVGVKGQRAQFKIVAAELKPGQGETEKIVNALASGKPILVDISRVKNRAVMERIVKHGDEYRLLSHKGKNLGDFDTKAGAEKHEREVQYFKHMGEGKDMCNVCGQTPCNCTSLNESRIMHSDQKVNLYYKPDERMTKAQLVAKLIPNSKVNKYIQHFVEKFGVKSRDFEAVPAGRNEYQTEIDEQGVYIPPPGEATAGDSHSPSPIGSIDIDEDNQMDTITMDIPFLIRVMEFAREDAKDDMILHTAVEKMLAAQESSETGVLTMDQYDAIFGAEQPEAPQEEVSEQEEFGYKKLHPEIFKARQKYPAAKSDMEALIMMVRDEEHDDVSRLDKVNDREDRDIESLDHEEDYLQIQIKALKTQLSRLEAAANSKTMEEDVPPPVATAGGPAGATQPKQTPPGTPVDPAQVALQKQQQSKLQQNLANLKTAGVQIDPAKAAQSLQKTDTGAPLNAMDKDTIAKMAPAIGNVMSNPSTATQLNTLIKKAGGGA